MRLSEIGIAVDRTAHLRAPLQVTVKAAAAELLSALGSVQNVDLALDFLDGRIQAAGLAASRHRRDGNPPLERHAQAWQDWWVGVRDQLFVARNTPPLWTTEGRCRKPLGEES